MKENSSLFELIMVFVKRGFLFLIMYFFFDAVKEFAGKETKTYAEIFIGFLANLQADKWIAYLFGLLYGGSSSLLYFREKKLRTQTENYYKELIEHLKKEDGNGAPV